MLTYLCWVCQWSGVGSFMLAFLFCLVVFDDGGFMHELCFETLLLLGLDCKPGVCFFIFHSLNLTYLTKWVYFKSPAMNLALSK